MGRFENFNKSVFESKDIKLENLLDAAACLWDETLNNKHDSIVEQTFGHIGTASVRSVIVNKRAVQMLEWTYNQLTDEDKNKAVPCFDFDYCAVFLKAAFEFTGTSVKYISVGLFERLDKILDEMNQNFDDRHQSVPQV